MIYHLSGEREISVGWDITFVYTTSHNHFNTHYVTNFTACCTLEGHLYIYINVSIYCIIFGLMHVVLYTAHRPQSDKVKPGWLWRVSGWVSEFSSLTLESFSALAMPHTEAH